jgi:hypothetical protein
MWQVTPWFLARQRTQPHSSVRKQTSPLDEGKFRPRLLSVAGLLDRGGAARCPAPLSGIIGVDARRDNQ